MTEATATKAKFDLAAAEEACFLRPAPGRCIILPDEFSYSGKLIIPDNAKRRGSTGRVVRINIADSGPESLSALWHGKRVVYGFYSGTPVKFSNRTAYIVIGYDEILAEIASDEEMELDARAEL